MDKAHQLEKITVEREKLATWRDTELAGGFDVYKSWPGSSLPEVEGKTREQVFKDSITDAVHISTLAIDTVEQLVQSVDTRLQPADVEQTIVELRNQIKEASLTREKSANAFTVDWLVDCYQRAKLGDGPFIDNLTRYLSLPVYDPFNL